MPAPSGSLHFDTWYENWYLEVTASESMAVVWVSLDCTRGPALRITYPDDQEFWTTAAEVTGHSVNPSGLELILNLQAPCDLRTSNEAAAARCYAICKHVICTSQACVPVQGRRSRCDLHSLGLANGSAGLSGLHCGFTCTKIFAGHVHVQSRHARVLLMKRMFCELGVCHVFKV